MNKMVKTISALAIASAFTLSCSDGGGDDSSSGSVSGPTTETYKMASIYNDYFIYDEGDDYRCTEDGLKAEKQYIRINYSIDNKVLTIKSNEDDDALRFNGVQNTLEGTWARARGKTPFGKGCSSNLYEDSEDSYYWYCDLDDDITKMVITNETIAITRDICYTDELGDWGGWTTKATDCNNTEIRKGNDVIKYNIKLGNNSVKETYTYNGKSCERSWSEPSVSQREKACKDAVEKAAEEGGDYYDYYSDILEGESWEKYEKCLKDNNFPEDFR